MTEHPDGDHLAPAGLKAAPAWAETATRVAGTSAPDADIAAATSTLVGEGAADLTIATGPPNARDRSVIGFRTTPAAAKRAGSEA